MTLRAHEALAEFLLLIYPVDPMTPIVPNKGDLPSDSPLSDHLHKDPTVFTLITLAI